MEIIFKMMYNSNIVERGCIMAVDNIKIEWSNDFSGTLESPSGKIKVGGEDGEMKPYHLLFGALGACFYSTFVEVAKKKRLTFDGATLEISGMKREEIPKTLSHVVMKLVIKNASNEAQFMRCVDYGIQFCSVHSTISKVAEIKTDVEFIF